MLTLLLVSADWNQNRRNTGYANANVYGTHAVQTTFAGFVLLSIANSIMILALGTEPPSHADNAYAASMKRPISGPAGTAAATGPVASDGVPSQRGSLAGGDGQTVV